MTLRIGEISLDCSDPERAAQFWCAALGYRITDRDETGVAIAGSSSAPTILLITSSEPKTSKNLSIPQETSSGPDDARFHLRTVLRALARVRRCRTPRDLRRGVHDTRATHRRVPAASAQPRADPIDGAGHPRALCESRVRYRATAVSGNAGSSRSAVDRSAMAVRMLVRGPADAVGGRCRLFLARC